MKNQTIKLLILTSIFPILLASCGLKLPLLSNNNSNNSTSNSSENSDIFSTTNDNTQPNIIGLLNDVEKKYQTFSIELKPEGKLLTKLEEEKAKSLIAIKEIKTTITNDLDNLIKTLENLNQFVNESEKKKITSLLLILKPSENKDNLGSILKLFEDNQLAKEEICEGIQKPLQVESVSNSNCGTFGNNTYIKISELFEKNNQEINTKIQELKNSLEKSNQLNNNSNQQTNNLDKTLFKEPLFIWTLINTILTLGLIGSFIWLYLLSDKIDKKNHQLSDKNERRKQEIKELETREQNRNQQINKMNDQVNKMNDRILDLKNSLDNLSLNVSNLLQTSPKIYPEKSQPIITPSKSSNPREEITPPLPENLRLANLYKENPQDLIQNAIRVSMTKETLNKVLAGTWEEIVEFEVNNRQGEYYIVANNSGESYLFLDPNTIFNIPTLQQINKSGLFICNGNLSQSFKGSEINIIKPAIVKPNNQLWRLIESGEIELV